MLARAFCNGYWIGITLVPQAAQLRDQYDLGRSSTMNDRDQKRHALSRRSLLKAGASAAGMAAVGLAPEAFAQSGFDWKRFKGEHLEVSLTLGPRGELLQKNRKEFEELTGITVGDEQVPEQQLYGRGKWLVDVRDYIKDPKLTNPDFDFADYAKGAMDYATQKDGRLDTLPLNLDYFVIYWNKELFAAKGVSYPKSFPEIIEAAAKLNDPKAGVAGWLMRGLKNANLPPYLTFLLGHGVVSMDPDLPIHMDGPA